MKWSVYIVCKRFDWASYTAVANDSSVLSELKTKSLTGFLSVKELQSNKFSDKHRTALCLRRRLPKWSCLMNREGIEGCIRKWRDNRWTTHQVLWSRSSAIQPIYQNCLNLRKPSSFYFKSDLQLKDPKMRAMILAFLLLGLGSSVRCLSLEPLCPGEEFEYEDVRVNAIHRIQINVTLEPVSHFMVPSSNNCLGHKWMSSLRKSQAKILVDD